MFSQEDKKDNKRHLKSIIQEKIIPNLNLHKNGEALLGVTTHCYLLEKLDPKHRKGKELEKEFFKWKKSITTKTFFTWLDEKEEKTHQYLIRTNYRETEEEWQKIRVTYQDNELYINGVKCDTSSAKGKMPGYCAYIITPDHQLLLTEHHTKFNNHATLYDGKQVIAAGMIKVVDGKIKHITNFSGHYKPGLIHLLQAIHAIPKKYFADDAVITYLKEKYPKYNQFIQKHHFMLFDNLNRRISRIHHAKKFNIGQFRIFAEVKLEKESGKFIYQRDKKKNRFENVLYESYLAKTIIENDETWRSLILRINQWIYDKLSEYHMTDKLIKAIIKYANKHSSYKTNKFNYLDSMRKILLEDKNLIPSLFFHRIFFEIMMPMYRGISFHQLTKNLPSYQRLRTDNLFKGVNRGTAMSSKMRQLIKYKHPFYRSNAFGIFPDEETRKDLANYFKGIPGKHLPAKKFYHLEVNRLPYHLARKNRDDNGEEKNQSYRDEMILNDISFIAGASGTGSKVTSMLIDMIGLTDSDAKEYLMVFAAACVAYGYHSIFEVMVLARNLGFPVKYNHQFYHEQFITDGFRKSEAYQKFLENYPDIINQFISPECDPYHEKYISVMPELEHRHGKEEDSTSLKI
ncbi:MAG: hypothetical protein ACD_46C00021G0006 [uncultured bacterium]|nr:MAG: hypothetical protein ACD_46C00021G0006 [uncultured bacterium]